MRLSRDSALWAVRWTIVRELITVLLVVAVFVLLPLLTACKNFPDRDERDPGTVLDVTTEDDDTVTVSVQRASDGTVYEVTGLDGTPCRSGDSWPECH